MNIFQLKNNLILAIMLARRDLKNRYAASYAGAVWNIAVPLLYALLNVAIFSMLMRGRMNGQYSDIPFILYYFVPMTLWVFFSDVIIRSTSILREYTYLISKINFPFWILPLIPIASALINQIILITIVIFLMIYYEMHFASSFYIYLIMWFICVIMSIGVSYFISALSIFIPDLVQIIPIVMNVIFWLTPILYPSQLVIQSGNIWLEKIIIDINPFYYIVEISRAAIFGNGNINMLIVLKLILLSIFLFVVGTFIFKKLKPSFADVI